MIFGTEFSSANCNSKALLDQETLFNTNTQTTTTYQFTPNSEKTLRAFVLKSFHPYTESNKIINDYTN